jgi:ubiquinone/menaquinone biosynthesis C-methylase UbiE
VANGAHEHEEVSSAAQRKNEQEIAMLNSIATSGPPRESRPHIAQGGSDADPTLKQQKLVDDFFQASASEWKELYNRPGVFEVIHQERRDAVLALVDKLGLACQVSILEIGCGAGLTSVSLAKRGYVVNAVDSVATMVDLTRQAAVEAAVGERVTAQVGDVARLPFPDNSFRMVLAMGVTPWLHSLQHSLREITRVLQPGGYLIVNADNRWRLNYALDPRCFPGLMTVRRKMRSVLERSGLLRPKPHKPRLYMYSLREFDSLLSGVGLRKLEGRTMGFGPFSFFSYKLLSESFGIKVHCKLQSLADRGFPVLRSTGTQYIVLAAKLDPNRDGR